MLGNSDGVIHGSVSSEEGCLRAVGLFVVLPVVCAQG